MIAKTQLDTFSWRRWMVKDASIETVHIISENIGTEKEVYGTPISLQTN